MTKRQKTSLVVHLIFEGLSKAKREAIQLQIAKLGATTVSLEESTEPVLLHVTHKPENESAR